MKRWSFLVLALALFPALAHADFEDRFGAPELVRLTDIRKTPQAYLEKVVRVRVRFDKLGDIYNPVYTRFVPESYTNFSAWGEEQLLWKESEYTGPFLYFFHSKRHPESKTLYELPRFAPIELVLYIHDLFREAAWIDVVAIQPYEAGVINDRILGHIARGTDHFRNRQWDACLREYKDALQYPIPRSYAAQVQKDVALVYYYKKGPEFRSAAEIELERAVELNPDHIHLRRLFLRAREENRLAEEEARRKKTRHGEGGG